LPARELFSVGVIVLAIALFASGFERSGLSTVAVGLLGVVLWSRANQKHLTTSLLKLMGKSFTDDLAAMSYTDDDKAVGKLKVAVKSQQAHLDAVLTRIEDSSG